MDIILHSLTKLKEEKQEEIEKLVSSNLVHNNALIRNNNNLEKLRKEMKRIDDSILLINNDLE